MNSFFFLLTGTTWYYHTLYLVFTYFASFTNYKDDIFEGISNFHFQGSEFGEKNYKFGENLKKKVELNRVYGVCFFQVCLTHTEKHL